MTMNPAIAAARAKINAPIIERPRVIIRKGKVNGPRRWLIYGPPGVGKTTFGASGPNPIIISAEDGANELGTDRFEVTTWPEAIESLRWLIDHDHTYKTLIVDTLDWLEEKLFAYVCAKANMKSMADFDWGAGYKEAMVHWREFQSLIETLQTKKQMHVVLIAHAVVKEHKNPMGDNYDQYVMKLYDKTASVMREWVSLIGFAQFEVIVQKSREKDTKGKARSTGTRVLYVDPRAGFVAKNRYNLPPKLVLDWKEVFDATERIFEKTPIDSPEIQATRKAIEELLPAMPDDKRDAVSAWLAEPDLTFAELQQTLNKVTVLVNENDEKKEEQ